MSSLPHLLIALLTTLASVARARAELPECGPQLPPGTRCAAEIAAIRPTQPEIGKSEVKAKTENYRKMSEEKLRSKVKEKVAPVVIGPDGNLYLTDHHHTLLAFQKAGIARAELEIAENWSGLGEGRPMEERMRLFWDRMIAENRCWLVTEKGELLDPLRSAWPRSLEECGNNRMRSVVYWLIQERAIAKRGIQYGEFHDAEDFRALGFDADEEKVKETVRKIRTYLASPAGQVYLYKRRCGDTIGRAATGD